MKSVYPIKLVGDVLTLQYGKPLPESGRTSEGGVPAYGANGVLCWSKKAFRTKPSIIVGRKGSAGEINLTEGPFWPTDVTYFVEHDERASELQYLFYALKLLKLQRLAKGVKPGINRNDVYRLKIPVPPLPEQKRIVAILDEAFEGVGTAVASAQTNLANARELFDSYLNSIFDFKGEHVRLFDLATDVTDGDHSPPPKAASGVPFITISNIVKSTQRIDFSNTFFVPQEYFDGLKPNKKPRIGDVLYTVTGATLGIPVLIENDTAFCFQRHIGLIRPKPEINSVWLSYALLSQRVFSQATVGSTGTAQKTVSLAVLRNITVPKISASEQCTVARKLGEINAQVRKLEILYDCKSERLTELKQAILQRAFAGALTAQPDQALDEVAA